MSTTNPTKINPPRDPEKLVDLPPHGPRNPDPISDQPGAHPIETGIGAVVGGAASGFAAGLVGGPVGAVVGAIAGGAVAGGLAGKGIGELIDPTTEDNWIRNLLAGKPDATDGWKLEAREAYRYGWRNESKFPRRTFAQVEQELRRMWEVDYPARSWEDHRGNVRDGYEQGREVNGTRQ